VLAYLRVASHSAGIILDFGTPDDRCVIAGDAVAADQARRRWSLGVSRA
jgi:hypothetical protein